MINQEQITKHVENNIRKNRQYCQRLSRLLENKGENNNNKYLNYVRNKTIHQYKLFTIKANKLTHLNRCLSWSTINYIVLIIRVIKARFISILFQDMFDFIFSSKAAKKQSLLLAWINFISKIFFQETFYSLLLLCYTTFYFYSLLQLTSRDQRLRKQEMEITSEMK